MANALSKTTVEELVQSSREISVRGRIMRAACPNKRISVWIDRFEEIEPEFLDWIDEIGDNATIWDVGASIGLFTVWAALAGSRTIVAFEPEAQNYSILEINHFLNKNHINGQFKTFNVALSDRCGHQNLYAIDYGAGEHGKILGNPITRGNDGAFHPEHIQSVLTVSLDDLIKNFDLPTPEYLKIDVDGSELDVVLGASGTLARGTIRSIFIEVESDSPTSQKALEILFDHGYREVNRSPVVRLSGGHYPNLFNIVMNN